MMQIGKTLVSDDLLDKEFLCNIQQCKGACCVEGEAGAPLEEKECRELENNFKAIKPFLNPKGLAEIEKQGLYLKGSDGDWETPIIDGKECVYTLFDAQGKASCGIEKAYNEGKISWKKPISCHLYPIRVQQYSEFTAVNYHHWQICDSGCSLGESLRIPVYVFVKEALLRKFGVAWYKSLEELARKNRN
ncbi:MAG: DUF3109 family protein [Flavobacteriaceae bacterium]